MWKVPFFLTVTVTISLLTSLPGPPALRAVPAPRRIPEPSQTFAPSRSASRRMTLLPLHQIIDNVLNVRC